VPLGAVGLPDRSWFALVSLFAAACSSGGQAPGPSKVAPGPAAGADCARELVVATYNVRFATPSDGLHRWAIRRERVGEQIRALGADLLGLQEVLAVQLDDLEAMLPGYAHEGVGRDDGARAGELAPLFYATTRFAREAGGTFWLSPTPDRPRGRFELKPWGTWHNRIATWVRLVDRQSGARFLVINTHFDHWSKYARLESARMVVDFVARHPADHTVLFGDINARRGSEPYHTLAAALRDAGTAPSVTRPAAATSVTVWTALGAAHHHIDHIFTSPGLRPMTYAIVDRRFFYSGAERYPSDHLPVVAHLCVL